VPVVIVPDEPAVIRAVVVVCSVVAIARSGRASRSRACTSGVGAARRTAGPGGEGCERAGLNVHAAEVLILGCSAVVAPVGEAEHAQIPVYAVLWELVSPRLEG
jgi:hypothetical protein